MRLSDPLIQLPRLEKPLTGPCPKGIMDEPMDRLLDYWKARLADAPILELPTGRPRPAVQSFRGASRQFSLPSGLTEKLNLLSEREGVTLFMTLAAAFQALLQRYSGQDDIVTGTPGIGRSRSEFGGGLPDFFVNTLVLRTDLSGDPGFPELLARVRETVLGAYEHQDMPFEKLAEALNRQCDRNPLFQVMFILRNSAGDEARLNMSSAESLNIDTGATPYDLSLELSETPLGLTGKVEYATGLFEAATIGRLVGHFQILLEGIAASPEARLSELPLLTRAERRQLLVDWNNTAAPFPQDPCIHALFEARAAAMPEAAAVACEDGQLNYAELNAQANRLAHRLIELGVGPDTRVAICAGRGLNMVVGLLAILKAGGAYVPLDPSYPGERLAFMLEDSAPAALLTQGRLQYLFEGMAKTVPVIDLDAGVPAWTGLPDTNPEPGIIGLRPEHLAYLIYTSGSTGKPKGVMVSHRNAVHSTRARFINYQEPVTAYLLLSSFAFDSFVAGLFWTLGQGGCLCLPADDAAKDPAALAGLIESRRISHVLALPSLHGLLLKQAGAALQSLKVAIVAGETCSTRIVEQHYALLPHVPLYNEYGPTEGSVWSSVYLASPDDLDRPLSIGRPISNVQIYILDRAGNPVPIGVQGELHIGGEGVARGYWHRPELTLERFVRDPFTAKAEARLYKTGDLARWRSDGALEFLGRNDFQVKIRGFRVELGDIEAKLAQHPAVREAAVAAREDGGGDNRLVAYVVPENTIMPGIPELRRFLKQKLPEYMVPSAFVFLDALPLTPNGKLDRKTLPEPDQSRDILETEFIAPRTVLEQQLAAIWADVLRIDPIGIRDNFFELGGHSLLATQVMVRAREQLRLEIPLRALFDLPTIAEFSVYLESLSSAEDGARLPAIRRYEHQAPPPLSFAQTRMWLLACLSGSSGAYNIPYFLRLDGALENEPALERAINEIVRRHDALRTCFIELEGEPAQLIQPSLSIALVKLDMGNIPSEQREAELMRYLQVQAATPFDLKKGPLLRAELIRLGDEQHVLLLTFHHIIADDWSMDVFARELSALHEAFSQGRPSPLPELPVQYADYAVWQREQLQGAAMERLLDYWKTQLAGLPILELPTDRPRPAVQSFRGATRQFNVPFELAAGLKALGKREGATLFMTLLAVFQVLLHRYSGRDDIAVGTPSGGRGHLKLEVLIGFFVNTLVLRTDLSGDPGFCELLARVRDVALGAYTQQDMPFEKLVEALNPQRDPGRNPLFQVMFALQNASGDTLQLNAVTAELLPVDTGTTQFDLSLELSETPRGLTGRVEYATALFEAATIDRLIGHFQILLEGIAARPEARLSELPLLTRAERRQLLVEWNGTAAPFPRDTCIHELFEARAAATPEAVAVVCEDSQLNYAELNAQANRLARYLRELGVKPDTRVAICVERGLGMMAGLLAILKAGGAYVPLDPDYPRERLAFMLEDSAPAALLTQGRLQNLFEGMAKTMPVIDLDGVLPAWTSLPDTNLDCRELGLTPKNLAYVIYTSGSTGTPKGVEIEHGGVCNMITDLGSRYGICAEDRILQFSALAFDVSVEEIFGALLSGAALVLRGDEWITGAVEFWALCENKGISVVNLPTLFWQQLVQENSAVIPATIRRIIIGGEAVSSKVLADWFEREGYRPKLFNAYGPTETTVTAAIHEPAADSLSWQAIGRPIANIRIYILDANRQPVPIGPAGELYIGGAGVARGYLNRPELTAERFVADPFAVEADARMYKTGDLARWLADGTIEFLGRNDFQVKIRGFRIELGDIEAKLMEHPAVRDAAVLAREDGDGFKHLVAYAVPEAGFMPDARELRDFLRENIPAYMMPSVFVFLKALPVTANGKLDRKALPLPLDEEISVTYAAPRNEIEHKLVAIWTALPGIGHGVGIRDNFFDLGGHSLLAVKAVAKINEQFNADLAVGAIYQSPTIEELGMILSSGNRQPSRHSLVPIQTQGSRPPLFAIHTITLLDLPQYLGKDQPLYFLRYGMAAKLGERSIPLPLLEDLAGHYIEEMRQLQPRGPYHLMGFSFGGMIAYEMARQLVATGQTVSFLGLLDTYLTQEKRLLPWRRIVHNVFKQGPRQFLARAKSKITGLTAPLKHGKDFWPHFYTETPDIACQKDYQPKPYGGRVTLFQAWEPESLFFSYSPLEQAWTRFLRERPEVRGIPGAHFEIFHEPHVKILATSISACMDKTLQDSSRP